MKREKLIDQAEEYLKNVGIEDIVMGIGPDGEFVYAVDAMADYLMSYVNERTKDNDKKVKDLSIDIYRDLNKGGAKLGSYSTTIIKNVLMKNLLAKEDLLYSEGTPEEVSSHISEKLLRIAFPEEVSLRWINLPELPKKKELCIVRCPSFSPDGYEIAAFCGGLFIHSTHGDITKYVTKWKHFNP